MTVAFKEWAVVCNALGAGRQSIIIRKGGIAEGRDGFRFRHEEFLLFPTWFHEQLERTTLVPDTPIPPEPTDQVAIEFAAVVEWADLVTDLDRVRRLRELHVLHDSVVEERFAYDDVQGVHVAFVRIFRLDPPLSLQLEKRFGGCRSWIDLPDASEVALVSVISDEEHARRRRILDEALA